MSYGVTFSTDLIATWSEAGGKTLTSCVNELVDNAADSGAKQITVEIDRNMIAVDDDGHGFSGTVEQGVSTFFTYGKSHGPKERLGRWGIGLKEAAPWLASILEMTSSNGTDALHIVANWDRMRKAESFDFDVAEIIPLPRVGTHILLKNVHSGRLTAQKKKQLKLELQKGYAPGLRQGLIAIHFRDGPGEPEQLRASPRPALIDRREFVGFYRTKEFRVVCGLLADRKENHEYSGWHFSYGPRVVKSDRAKLEGFYGEVVLIQKKTGRDWRLDRHKTDFDERDGLVLHLQKRPEIQELIGALQSKKQTIRLDEIEGQAKVWLKAILAGVQQQKRPGPHVEEGTKIPKGGSRILDQAAVVNPENPGHVRRGPKPPEELPDGLEPDVHWVDWLPTQPIGECQLDRNRVDIAINKHHPWFNDQQNLRAMMTVAMMLLAESLSRCEGFQFKLALSMPDPIQSRQTVRLLSYLLGCVHTQYPMEISNVSTA